MTIPEDEFWEWKKRREIRLHPDDIEDLRELQAEEDMAAAAEARAAAAEAAQDAEDPEDSAARAAAAAAQLAEHDPTGTDLARRVARMARGGPAPKKKEQQARPATPTFSGAGADPRDPKTAGALLNRLIEERGWRVEVNVHVVAGRWEQVVGADVARHSTPEAFNEGVLVVRTDTTAWAVQLRTLAPQLLAKLNDAVGQGSIVRVEVRGPEAPQRRRGRLRVKGEGPRDTYG